MSWTDYGADPASFSSARLDRARPSRGRDRPVQEQGDRGRIGQPKIDPISRSRSGIGRSWLSQGWLDRPLIQHHVTWFAAPADSEGANLNQMGSTPTSPVKPRSHILVLWKKEW
ncbi:hypothetical protein Taro_008106 [Colocasia esculenta]|uniref:Uncharacterized protein n=1 Tax=Colocasia esculenta TaxID=4460 RepID=A0A843TWQ1_COLES|nr:hypothetical protein [Colocasia esculenta]